MTLEITRPETEARIQRYLRSGQFHDLDELLTKALDALPEPAAAVTPASGRTIAEQGRGLFGSPEDAALLDEIVSLAYAERRRPSQRKPTL